MVVTGKDLIIYILKNNLEHEQINLDNGFFNFLTVKEAAAKFNVGEATVRIWHQLGAIDGLMLGETLYISPDAKPKVDF